MNHDGDEGDDRDRPRPPARRPARELRPRRRETQQRGDPRRHPRPDGPVNLGSGAGDVTFLHLHHAAVELAVSDEQPEYRREAQKLAGPARVGRPHRDGEPADKDADDPPRGTVRVLDEEPEFELAPVLPGEVPRLRRPDGVGHADAKRRDEPAEDEQQQQRDRNGDDRPKADPPRHDRNGFRGVGHGASNVVPSWSEGTFCDSICKRGQYSEYRDRSGISSNRIISFSSAIERTVTGTASPTRRAKAISGYGVRATSSTPSTHSTNSKNRRSGEMYLTQPTTSWPSLKS